MTSYYFIKIFIMAGTKDTAARKRGAAAAALLAATAAAGAAGYYFYASKDAAKHRRIAAKWANDLKNDVVKQAKKVKTINKNTVAKIVDEAAAAYQGVRNLDRGALKRAVAELKNNWDRIEKEIKGAKTPTKKTAATRGAKKVKKTAGGKKSA